VRCARRWPRESLLLLLLVLVLALMQLVLLPLRRLGQQRMLPS
jgi:hypothetical protein